jgi:hypothetical protein
VLNENLSEMGKYSYTFMLRYKQMLRYAIYVCFMNHFSAKTDMPRFTNTRLSSSESSGTMMEATRTSETSVDIELRTQQYIPEDSELHTRRRENLKSL